MSKFEKLILIFGALFLSSFCYLYGWLQPASGKVYTGIRSLNASDYNPNLAWIEQFRKGNVFAVNLYTSDPQRAFLVRPVYFLLSAPFAFAPVSNTLILHLIRVFCGFVLLWAAFRFLSAFIDDLSAARYAFWLLIFTSGAGIVLRSVLPASADLNLPEAIPFLSLGEVPHFVYSLLFLWGGIISLWLAGKEPRYQWAYYLCLVLLWWEHPFDAITLAALAFASAWNQSGARKIVVPGATILISLGPALYYRSLAKSAAFGGWSVQMVMLTPHFPALLSAFLPLLLLAIPSLIHYRSNLEKRKWLLFLLVWILLQFALVYAPVSFQRRFIAGVQFPLAILAALTLNRWRKNFKLLPWLLIFFLTTTNVFVMKEQVQALQSKEMPFYLPISYKNMFDWMETQKTKDAVLSGFITGNFIPGYTGFPVYIGHSAQTPRITEKRAAMLNFFRKPDSRFLQKENIAFIFWGLEEQRIGGPDLTKMMEVVHREGPLALLIAKPLEGRHMAFQGAKKENRKDAENAKQ